MILMGSYNLGQPMGLCKKQQQCRAHPHCLLCDCQKEEKIEENWRCSGAKQKLLSAEPCAQVLHCAWAAEQTFFPY